MKQPSRYYKGIEICPIRIPKNCKNSIKCELISDNWFFFRKTKQVYEVYEATTGVKIVVGFDKDKIVHVIANRIDEITRFCKDKERSDMAEES